MGVARVAAGDSFNVHSYLMLPNLLYSFFNTWFNDFHVSLQCLIPGGGDIAAFSIDGQKDLQPGIHIKTAFRFRSNVFYWQKKAYEMTHCKTVISLQVPQQADYRA